MSDYFRIDANKLDKRGILNPMLDADTRLFIDPMLLGESSHREISEQAVTLYRNHFDRVLRVSVLDNGLKSLHVVAGMLPCGSHGSCLLKQRWPSISGGNSAIRYTGHALSEAVGKTQRYQS